MEFGDLQLLIGINVISNVLSMIVISWLERKAIIKAIKEERSHEGSGNSGRKRG